MTEYKESSVAGTSYKRGRSLYFENPRNNIPALLIREELVTILTDREIIEPAGEILKNITDLSISFPLRNPQTNEIIENLSMTYQDLYVGLFSLYWHLAEERDQINQPSPTPEPTPAI